MSENLFIEHGYKAFLSGIIGLFAYLFNRSIKKNDEDIKDIKDRVDQLEEDQKQIIAMSVKLDMMIESTARTNTTLDDVSRRVQGVEVNVARLSGSLKKK